MLLSRKYAYTFLYIFLKKGAYLTKYEIVRKNIPSIGWAAFNECGKFEITIPDSVTSIGFQAFELDYASFTDYGSLGSHIYYNGTVSGSPWGANAIN